MERIINEEALLEDTIEGLAEYLNIDNGLAKEYIKNDDMEWIIESMFCTQSDCIMELGERFRDEKFNKSIS